MITVIQSKEHKLANIRQHSISSKYLFELRIPGILASVETVASSLFKTSIAHFACHEKQNLFKPLDSGLKLNDGLLRIMKEKMPNRSLHLVAFYVSVLLIGYIK